MRPDAQVQIIEQNPADATFGFGVVVKAATASLRWYEDMDRHMQLEPYEFAYSYITRSGRVDDTRLQQIAPHFMGAYNAHRNRAGRA